jgi:predicted secreted protein
MAICGIFLVASCKEPDFSSYRHLDTGKVNLLYKGEKFVLYNSRTDGLEYDNSLRFDIDTTFIKLIDSYEEPSPKGCDGCSSYYTIVYQAIREGKTTIKAYRKEFADSSLSNEQLDSLLAKSPPDDIEKIRDSLKFKDVLALKLAIEIKAKP